MPNYGNLFGWRRNGLLIMVSYLLFFVLFLCITVARRTMTVLSSIAVKRRDIKTGVSERKTAAFTMIVAGSGAHKIS